VPKWVPAGTHRLSYRLEWSPESHTFERRIERQWSGWTIINKDHIIDAFFNEEYDPIILTSQYHYERTSVDGNCSCTLTCSFFQRWTLRIVSPFYPPQRYGWQSTSR
jgi:hypothetical protein